MSQFPEHFLIGASTAAHQVEGNNIHSDYWAMENIPHTSFAEPSLDAVDHYNRYEEDIKLLADAGLNAYRFSIEWARIEPVKGQYDEAEIGHYRRVLECCRANGITPIVTMHHFTSPAWLIAEGGWENPETVEHFKNYCEHVVRKLGGLMEYVVTINEANMGLQMATIMKRILKQMGLTLQIGMNFTPQGDQLLALQETAEALGMKEAAPAQTFVSQRTPEGDILVMHAHEAARDAMKAACPHLKVGISLSLHDTQAIAGGEENAAKDWDEEFRHYLPYISNDDFFGLQNYTRQVYGPEGVEKAPEGARMTQMNYENYPEALEHVIRTVAKDLSIPIIATENGIATADDAERVEFIQKALAGVKNCIADGIDVRGYCHWSLMDNFEWQKGFSMTFGLIAVDRTTQTRHPKESLKYLGSFCCK